jgi:hypothetical protein
LPRCEPAEENTMTSPAPLSAEQKALRLAKLFDLRTFIGALFTIFGVLVTIEGFFASDADIQKAAGLRLALWLGLIMLGTGLGFIGWMLTSPPDIVRGHPAEDPPDQDLAPPSDPKFDPRSDPGAERGGDRGAAS